MRSGVEQVCYVEGSGSTQKANAEVCSIASAVSCCSAGKSSLMRIWAARNESRVSVGVVASLDGIDSCVCSVLIYSGFSITFDLLGNMKVPTINTTSISLHREVDNAG